MPEFLRDLGLPAESRLHTSWSIIDGRRWHCRSSRKVGGIPFVLVHGLMISSLYMIPLAECLAQSADVHAIDLPGFGRSEGPLLPPSIPAFADATIRWLDTAGIDRCHIIANSMGCQVTADLACRYPHRVVSVTLIGPVVDSRAHSISRQALRLASELFHEPVRLWLNHLVDFFRAGPVRTFAMARQMFRDRITEKLPAVRVPALILRGENDAIAPERWIRECAEMVQRGSSCTIAAAAHCVHYTRPRETMAAVQAFIRTHHES